MLCHKIKDRFCTLDTLESVPSLILGQLHASVTALEVIDIRNLWRTREEQSKHLSHVVVVISAPSIANFYNPYIALLDIQVVGKNSYASSPAVSDYIKMPLCKGGCVILSGSRR